LHIRLKSRFSGWHEVCDIHCMKPINGSAIADQTVYTSMSIDFDSEYNSACPCIFTTMSIELTAGENQATHSTAGQISLEFDHANHSITDGLPE